MNPSAPDAKVFLGAYLALVLGAGAGLLLGSWIGHDLSIAPGVPLLAFGFWLMLSLAAECFWLETPSGAGMVSIALAVNIATIFVLPRHQVLMVGACSVGLSDLLLHRRGPLRAVFNAAQTVVALWLSLRVLSWLAGPRPLLNSQIFLEHPLAVAAALLAFFFANTLLVAGVIALHRRIALWAAWRENYGFGYQFLSSGTQCLIGLTLVVAVERLGYISGLLSLLTFFFVRDAYTRYARERVRHEALAHQPQASRSG